MSITIGNDGRVTGELLEPQTRRASNLTPVMTALRHLVDDPASYQRPDRFRGGAQVGPITSDPGYSGHVSARVRGGVLQILSSRPHMPRLTPAVYRRMAEAIAHYIATGELRGT